MHNVKPRLLLKSWVIQKSGVSPAIICNVTAVTTEKCMHIYIYIHIYTHICICIYIYRVYIYHKYISHVYICIYIHIDVNSCKFHWSPYVQFIIHQVLAFAASPLGAASGRRRSSGLWWFLVSELWLIIWTIWTILWLITMVDYRNFD